jgi:hypothetical protein
LKIFFDTVRENLAGGKLTPGQVGGLDALLAATQGLDVKHRAYLLATAWHETAFTMQPIVERGSRRYFDKYEQGLGMAICIVAVVMCKLPDEKTMLGHRWNWKAT